MVILVLSPCAYLVDDGVQEPSFLRLAVRGCKAPAYGERLSFWGNTVPLAEREKTMTFHKREEWGSAWLGFSRTTQWQPEKSSASPSADTSPEPDITSMLPSACAGILPRRSLSCSGVNFPRAADLSTSRSGSPLRHDYHVTDGTHFCSVKEQMSRWATNKSQTFDSVSKCVSVREPCLSLNHFTWL